MAGQSFTGRLLEQGGDDSLMPVREAFRRVGEETPRLREPPARHREVEAVAWWMVTMSAI
jgi:hypothetical protein